VHCPDCGKQNRDAAKVCAVCGLTLGEVAVGQVLGASSSAPAKGKAAAPAAAAFALLGLVGWLVARGGAPPAPRNIADSASATAPPVARQVVEMINPKDQMILIRIPGGTYTMGSDEGDSDEKPAHQVTLQPYAMGKTEVTNAQYRAFVAATHHETAGDWAAYAGTWGDQAPVVGVSWHDATAYCQWAGLRLPTEAEWEAAARGPEGRTYPWGDTWDASKCSNSVGGRPGSAGTPVAVGSYPQGASPFGCLDMAGNVWEWCSSKYQPYPYDAADGREASAGREDRVLRGGSLISSFVPIRFRGAYRYRSLPTYGYDLRGFRAARTL
jgi:formylglycine-generating enzyme required for sulfatase activity